MVTFDVCLGTRYDKLLLLCRYDLPEDHSSEFFFWRILRASKVYHLCYNIGMKILEKPITRDELIKTSANFIDENTIKAAVDVKRELIAVDSPMHYDCEQLLLQDGSEQTDIWGINLYLDEENIDNLVEFDSMINIRPAQGNRSRSVEDPEIQSQIKNVVAKWLK